jgi:hypothetical protein
MAAARDERVDVLIQEVRELKRDIKELRLLLVYGLLKTEEQRSRGGFNDTLLAFAKQALKAAIDQLAEPDHETGTHVAKKPRSTRASAKSREDARKPVVDVNNEIAILKKEMAKSLREAAKDVDDEHDVDEADTE